MTKNKSTLGMKTWTLFVVYSLVGQLAWTIENMYLNLYIYRTVTYDPNAIAWMVALSAVVATLTTLFMGALSDKLGKRKIFISLGYMLWGVSIVLFAFITKENISKLFPNSNVIFMTVFLIILLDCIMTFFGSTANDAAFNIWVTDMTSEDNRGKVEGVLSAMPLIGMLVIFGIFDSFTQNKQWLEFYLILGSIVFIAGFLGLFFIKDIPKEKERYPYFKNLFHGFNITTFKENKSLYITYFSMAAIGIAQQVFMPYFIIYFQYYLGISDYALVLGAILILASVISVIGGRMMDQKDKKPFLIFASFTYILSLLMIFILGLIIKDNLPLIIVSSIFFGTVLMGAYLLIMVVLNALSRDLVPVDRIGAFNGIRMIFYVTIPMIIGPFIGSAIIKGSNQTFTDEFGVTQLVPSPYIFFGACLVAIFALIPVYRLIKSRQIKEG